MNELTVIAGQTDERHSELDDIVYRISHDLRASVRALKDLPGWLEEDLQEMAVDLGETAHQTVHLIQSHARRLDEMLNGLLAYSRVGRLQELVVCAPQQVFQDVIRDMAPGPDIAFFAQFNPVEVRMGSSDIAKVFQILISNAIVHNPGAEKQVEITSCRSGAHWELLVADNGPGIDAGAEEDIFRPMVKLVSRDQDEGGGMGLAILRKIAELYGGSVHVEPRRRKGGSTFRLRIPALA